MQKESEKLICARCKKEIPNDIAYVLIQGSIILRGMFDRNPNIFTCKEQAANYSRKLVMHDQCWIDTLKDHGIKLYDMNKVAEEYMKRAEDLKKKAKENKDGMGSGKTSK